MKKKKSLRDITKYYIALLLFFLFAHLNAQNASCFINSNGAPYPAGTYPTYVSSGDFNNDGLIDLAVTNSNSNDVSILLAMANGSYAAAVNYITGSHPNCIIVKDFNGDGKLDLAITNGVTNDIRVFNGNGNGTFANPYIYSVGTNPSFMCTGDFNNDGFLDLAVTNQGSNNISIRLGMSGGLFSSQTTYSVGSYPSSIIAKDLNADGKLDFAVTNQISNSLMIFIGNGNGTFGTPVSYSASLYPLGVVSEDFNGDNIPDIAVSNASNASSIMVWLGTGTGSFNSPASFSLSSTQLPNTLVAKDFNGDNKIDLVYPNWGSADIGVLIGDGNGAFAAPYSYTVGNYPGSISINDFNSDGKPDMAVSNNADHNVSVLLNAFSSLTVSNSSTICPGQTVTLVASGSSFSYYWNTGATVNSITVSPSNTISYTVTGSSSTGCTNNAVITISVATSSVNVIGSSTVCAGSSLNYAITGVNSQTWSTGSLSNTINILPLANSVFTVSGNDLNNCAYTRTFNITLSPCSNVWPGDANSDGLADNLDVLELGLHMSQTGPARAITSNAWQAFYANNWSGLISSGKNLNHSDCDGSGLIDLNDTLAISNNYNSTHTFKQSSQTLSATDLSIIPDQSIVVKNSWGTASIYLGDSTNIINNINGVAFTISFDNTLIEQDSIYLKYQASFIDPSISNLHFQKKYFNNGLIHAANTHTNAISINGFGKIATLYFKINPALTAETPLNFNLSQVYKSGANGTLTSLVSGSASVMATTTLSTVGIRENLLSTAFSIYPNPTNGQFIIDLNKPSQIIIYNVLGEIVLNEKRNEGQNKINLSQNMNGIYFVKVIYQTNQQTIKLIKN